MQQIEKLSHGETSILGREGSGVKLRRELREPKEINAVKGVSEAERVWDAA